MCFLIIEAHSEKLSNRSFYAYTNLDALLNTLFNHHAQFSIFIHTEELLVNLVYSIQDVFYFDAS